MADVDGALSTPHLRGLTNVTISVNGVHLVDNVEAWDTLATLLPNATSRGILSTSFESS